MLFSHRVIKMAWAHRAQPPFHKKGALAHKALEEGGDGNGTKKKYCGYDGHVSQLFIFIHVGARRGTRRTRGRRGARRRIQDKADHRCGPRRRTGHSRWSSGRCLPSHRHLGRPPLRPSSSSSGAWQSAGTYIPAMDEACSISRNLRSGGRRAPSVRRRRYPSRRDTRTKEQSVDEMPRGSSSPSRRANVTS